MCVATAIIIGAAATAGGTIASAKISSNAAKKAAQTQSDAGDKALAFQREQYEQARQEFNPYQQAGYGALGRLGTAAAAPPVNFQPGQSRQLGLPQGVPPAPMGARVAAGGAAPGGGVVAAGLQGTPVAGPGPAATAPPNAPQNGASAALWTLQAPDGTTKQLPPEVAQQFVARGATRVA